MTRISPEPADEHRAAILAAVQAILDREAARARPPAWAVGGWTHRRAGVRDLPLARRWALSVRMPWGGREYPGLMGRGDAK